MEEFLIRISTFQERVDKNIIIECNRDEVIKTLEHKLGVEIRAEQEYLYSQDMEISVYEIDEIIDYRTLKWKY